MSFQLKGVCPRCRKGEIFKHPIYHLGSFAQMHHACPECEASYEPEPGFYFGAMFVSYAFTVAIMFVIWLSLYLTIDPPTSTYIYSFLIAVIIATPFSFRYSRIVWLYWFGGHTRIQ